MLPQLTSHSIVVYELSSFQLFDLHKSPHIAVCLLVTEDHLDWHRDLEHYHESKGNIFKHQKESDYAIWFADNDVSCKLSSHSKSHNRIPYGKKSIVRVENNMFMHDTDELIPTSEAALPGTHNQENICAAIAATYHLVSRDSIIHTIQTQGSLAYHIEDKGTIHGIQFINDSFSTNPTATEVAVYATAPKNTILLIGGVDRGLHLDPHVRALTNAKHITHVVCYGAMRERLFATLAPYTKNIRVCEGDLRTTLQHAISLASDGTTILFSPGAPSFDMFTDYKARGEAFNALLDDFKQNLL